MTIDVHQMEVIVDEGKQQSVVHRETVRTTVRQLVRTLGVSQGDLAKGLGITRQSFHGRLTGATQFHLYELDALAEGLNIEREVLDMAPMDAIRWVTDHPDLFPNIRWSPLSPLRAA